MYRYKSSWFLFLSLALTLVSCQSNSTQTGINPEKGSSDGVKVHLPSASIYEVNIRQYTPEGTMDAFLPHLPRLKEMGVDILWFMPVFPISEVKRKGGMGSYYAVQNYREINPEFGSLEDFRSLVDSIHAMDMLVILDWVPNHTGWDHPWIEAHPEWYTKNPDTDTIIHPEATDWYDVADLNYEEEGLKEAMISDLSYWVQEIGIDGYRMDVADRVPMDFWHQCMDSLRKIRSDLFMLAESAHPPHRNEGLFSSTYGWDLLHTINKIAKGELSPTSIWEYLKRDSTNYKLGWHMTFTTNHDENSWQGTVFERYGDQHLAYSVLTSTLHGMPLIYSGQEAAMNKRLRFFEKDTIFWGEIPYHDFYRTLLHLKKDHPALHNGEHGSSPSRIRSSENVIAYWRQKGADTVVVAVNLSADPGTWEPGDLLNDLSLKLSSSSDTKRSEIIEGSGYQIWSR